MKIKATALAIGLAFASLAQAQTTPAPDATLDRVMKTHTFIIGVRDASVPLSYRDGKGGHVGLAVDLCNKIADSVKTIVPDVKVNYVEVTSSNRIDFVKQGKIDVECGSTTDNDSRQKQVSFTIPYFYSGISGDVLANSPYHMLGDLPDGSIIAYTKGTTTATAVGTLDKSFYFRNKDNRLKKVEGKDHQESFNFVRDGKAAAFLNDDILVYGLIANSDNPKNYRMLTKEDGTEQVFSVEPYGIMFRLGSPRFARLADHTIAGLMQSGEFTKMYDQWFMQPIPPKGANLNVPMSHLLKDLVRNPTDVIGGYTK